MASVVTNTTPVIYLAQREASFLSRVPLTLGEPKMDANQFTLVALVVSILALVVPLFVFLRKPSGPKGPVALDPNKKASLLCSFVSAPSTCTRVGEAVTSSV